MLKKKTQSYVSDKTAKEIYPFGLNVLYNMCPIIPQNKDSIKFCSTLCTHQKEVKFQIIPPKKDINY
jgi:hypothetical protein